MRRCGCDCGIKVQRLTKALITVANTSPTNPNLTNCTFPLPFTFSLALVSRILPIATPACPHFSKCWLSAFEEDKLLQISVIKWLHWVLIVCIVHIFFVLCCCFVVRCIQWRSAYCHLPVRAINWHQVWSFALYQQRRLPRPKLLL